MRIPTVSSAAHDSALETLEASLTAEQQKQQVLRGTAWTAMHTARQEGMMVNALEARTQWKTKSPIER